jgi:hypothetical protein
MNERIKELALDAGIGFTLWDDSGREMIDNYTPEEHLEKFAELIVRECISIVDDAERGGSNEIWDNAVKFIRRDLQEHFGVEE